MCSASETSIEYDVGYSIARNSHLGRGLTLKCHEHILTKSQWGGNGKLNCLGRIDDCFKMCLVSLSFRLGV
jgi:hypothetical protein